MLRRYIYIGIGGCIGAILRFMIKDVFSGQRSLPFDTLLINTSGCFLLALIMSVALEVLKQNSNLKLGIATGLLGAFTTFSTICKEVSSLIFEGLYFQAILYIASTLLFGLLAIYLGISVSREMIRARTALRRSDPANNYTKENEEQL